MQFTIGEFYTRKEVHQLVLGKPLPKTGTGNWLTGYVKVENDFLQNVYLKKYFRN